MNSKRTEKKRAAGKVVFIVLLLVVAVLTLPVLYGCKKSSNPVPAKPAPPVRQAVEVTPEAPAEEEKKKDPGYLYNRRGRRDPFKPLIEIARRSTGESSKTMGTLESYDISDFSVLGIGTKGDRYFALLQSPDNKSFTVNKGDIIGLNNGKIDNITQNKVVTIEKYTDPFGKIKSRQIILELHKGEE